MYKLNEKINFKTFIFLFRNLFTQRKMAVRDVCAARHTRLYPHAYDYVIERKCKTIKCAKYR